MLNAQEKLEKIKQLNARWFKGCELYQQGVFASPEQRRNAVKRFTAIVAELFPLVEQLHTEAPALLDGIELLPEPPEPTDEWQMEGRVNGQ